MYIYIYIYIYTHILSSSVEPLEGQASRVRPGGSLTVLYRVITWIPHLLGTLEGCSVCIYIYISLSLSLSLSLFLSLSLYIYIYIYIYRPCTPAQSGCFPIEAPVCIRYTALSPRPLYYAVPYHTILYCTVLYYAMLYYIILCYTILYYTILYYTILYYTILQS